MPGAPFTQDELDEAVTTVRNAARWHICPARTDTITLDIDHREPTLRLPTKRLVSVDEVRDTDTAAVIDAAHYRVSLKQGDVRKRWGFWPSGYGRIEVDMTHGYDDVPDDLLPVFAQASVVARRDQTASRLSAGPFNIELGTGEPDGAACDPLSSAAILDRYTYWTTGLA